MLARNDVVGLILFLSRLDLVEHVVVDSVVALPHDCLLEHPGLTATAAAEAGDFSYALSLAFPLLARHFESLILLGFNNIDRNSTDIIKNPFRHSHRICSCYCDSLPCMDRVLCVFVVSRQILQQCLAVSAQPLRVEGILVE